MSRSAYFRRTLVRLYNDGDLDSARDLFKANPSGIRYHLSRLVAVGLLPAFWEPLVCGGVVAPHVVARELDARLPVVPS